MQLLYVIGTGVLAAFCVLLAVRICYQRRYIRTSDRINDCIFRNVAAYLLADRPRFQRSANQLSLRDGNRTASRAAQGGQPVCAPQERRGRRRLRHARIVRRLSRPRGHHRGVPDEERLLGTGGPDGALHLRRPHGNRRLRRKRGGQFPHRRRTTPGGADRERHLGPETHPARTGESPRSRRRVRPHEITLPGQHEPRTAHAAERHHRILGTAHGRPRPDQETGVHAHHPLQRRGTDAETQRHPRSLEDRSRNPRLRI